MAKIVSTFSTRSATTTEMTTVKLRIRETSGLYLVAERGADGAALTVGAAVNTSPIVDRDSAMILPKRDQFGRAPPPSMVFDIDRKRGGS